MEVKKRMVVAGAGSIGKRHARLLAGRKDISVELCDPDSGMLNAALAETGLLPVHHSFEKMLDSKPDMVLIASPNKFHTEQTLLSLKAGAHVLCEKPMSDRLDTAFHVLDYAKQSDRVLVYGFSNHFHPGIIRSREIIGNGRLGEILYAHFHIGTYGTLVNSKSRYQADTEDALLMDYVHQPDLLWWILGKTPAGVYATGSRGGTMALSSHPNSITILLDYNDPTTASIHLDYIQYPDRYHFEFLGDLGWIYYDLIANILYFGDRNKTMVSKEVFEFARDTIYEKEHQAFLDVIAGKRLPESSAGDAIQSMVFVEAAKKSWRTKKRIKWDEVFSSCPHQIG